MSSQNLLQRRYTISTYLTTLRGQIATATLSEIFIHTLAIDSPSTGAQVASDIVTSWRANMTAEAQAHAFFPTVVQWTEATAAEIIALSPVPGQPSLKAAFHAAFQPPLTGLGANAMLPSQNALVVSLIAGVRGNGAPLKGRFYLPPGHTGDMGADGTISSQLQDGISRLIVAHFNQLTAMEHTPCVWVRNAPKTQTAPGLYPIDTVRVGNKFDTQRRRRNKIAESFVSSPI